MKFGLLTYSENKRTFNIGDYIQSIAALQFLPKVDSYINRENLADFNGMKTKLIMNGWFTHNIQNWVPNEAILPLFVSFHINNTAAPTMLSEKGIAYLNKHQPIGCRDLFTVDLLKGKGITAYFSGCLTLTLDTYKVEKNERGNDIYIVDPLFSYPSIAKVCCDLKSLIRGIQYGTILKLDRKEKHLSNFIDKELLKTALYITQEPPAHKYSDEEKFNMAEDLLNKYARAKLVITSRIHCALPCLALGTPVIFINGFDKTVDSCRFEGIIELFNRIDLNTRTGEFEPNFQINGKITDNLQIENPDNYKKLTKKLKHTCYEFIRQKL